MIIKRKYPEAKLIGYDYGQPIAKQLGGGGHKGAAGFQIEDISTIFPFLKNK